MSEVRAAFEKALAGSGRCYGCYCKDDVLGFLVVRIGGGPMEKIERRLHTLDDEVKVAREMGQAYAGMQPARVVSP